MMRLYLDVGNTRFKWRHDAMDSAMFADNLEGLRRQWGEQTSESIESVVGSCVRGAQLSQAVEQISQACFGVTVDWQYSSARACGVTNAYAEPRSLGVDRWLALIAAHKRFPDQSCIVVDAGTAITVDLLDASGQHRGGVIMPGAQTMLSSLARAEQLFPDASRDLHALARSPQALTRSTQDALLAGAIFAVQGGVKAVIAEQARKIGAKIDVLPILLTGGDLPMLKLDSLRIIAIPDLVLEGLQQLTEKN